MNKINWTVIKEMLMVGAVICGIFITGYVVFDNISFTPPPWMNMEQ